MSDSLSKIISIMIAAVVMFIAPVRINLSRQSEIIQTYILSETMYLVDNVRNTGKLSHEMYDEYMTKVYAVCNQADINISVKKQLTSDDTDIVLESLEETGCYDMDKDDYFRVVVMQKDKTLAYYGGMVKQ